MTVLDMLYKPSLALLTDLYQLTMAYGYWKSGMTDRDAVFHLYFRKNPFKGGYTIACESIDEKSAAKIRLQRKAYQTPNNKAMCSPNSPRT